jgi:hypothetical protein
MKLALLATALSAALLPSLAVAGTLPPGSVTGTIRASNGSAASQIAVGAGPAYQAVAPNDQSHTLAGTTLGVSTTGFRGLQLGGFGAATAQDAFAESSASVQMSYQFMITGGGPGQTFVPITLHERGGLTHSDFAPGEIFAGDAGGDATTILSLVDDHGQELHFAETIADYENDGASPDSWLVSGGGMFIHKDFSASASAGFSGAFDGFVTLDNPAFNELQTNRLYTVNLTMNYLDGVGATGGPGYSFQYSAFLDAALGFAGGFDSTGYRITFSDGFGPDILGGGGGSGGVPEPASWALMIAGFGLAGGRLRRRRVARA